MSNAVPQKKTFFQIANKNFIMLFVAYTVICITHSMTNSVTSAGWRLAGMDLTTIGLIASAMSWAAFIIRPFSAPITDRGNKKLIYIAAVGALTLAVFMYSLSMDNSAFAGVIMRHAVPLIDHLCAAAICSSGNDRFSLAALYQLDGAMKNSNMRFLLS